MRLIAIILTSLLLSGCVRKQASTHLQSVHLIDRNDFSQTISDITKLRAFENTDLFSDQPYRKLMRTYFRNEKNIQRSCVSSYYESGQIRQFLEIINGRASGRYIEWYNNGQIKISAMVLGGKADLGHSDELTWIFDGACTAWSSDGKIEALLPYSKGKKHGQLFLYYPDGSLMETSTYIDDLLDGARTVYDKTGDVILLENYVEGKIDGFSKGFFMKKMIFVEEFEKDHLINSTYTSEDGSVIGSVKNGSGTRIIFCNGKVRERRTYVNGLQNGPVEHIDSNGNTTRIACYKNGLLNGEDIEFFIPNIFDKFGKKTRRSLVQWDNGVIQGTVKTWYPNGRMESSHERTNESREGVLTCYYSDGSVSLVEEYKGNLLSRGQYYRRGTRSPVSEVEDGNGVAIIFNDNGFVRSRIKYKEGLPTVN